MWIVMTSSAQSPHVHGGGQYGEYRNVALVEIYDHIGKEGWRPSRIDKRIAGVLRVEHWGRYYVGKKPTSAYARTLREAERSAEERNRVGQCRQLASG